MEEQRVYVILVAKGGAQLQTIMTLSKLIKKFRDVLKLETIGNMSKHESAYQSFGNESWLKSLTLVKLG